MRHKSKIIRTGFWLLFIASPLFIGLLWGAEFQENVYVILRYANNLASGLGLNYLPVGNSTFPSLNAPSYSLILSLIINSGLDILTATAVISLLGWSSAIMAFRSIGNSLDLKKGAMVSAFLLSINPWIIQTLGELTPWLIAIFWIIVALILKRRFLFSILLLLLGVLLIVPWPPNFPWPHLYHYIWPLIWSTIFFTAGFGAQWLAKSLSRHHVMRTNEKQTIALLLSFVLLIFGGFQLNMLWQAFQFRPLAAWNIEHEIAFWLQTETDPTSNLLATEKIGFLARRPAIPYHQLPDSIASLAAKGRELPAYLVSHHSLDWQNITAAPWFHLNYQQVKRINDPVLSNAPFTIWEYRNPEPNLEPRQALNARVPDRLRLLGYQLGPYLPSAGDSIHVALSFQLPEAGNQSLDSFTSIIRLDSQSIGSTDANWEITIPHSELWQPGYVFSETISLPLPSTLENGAYQLNISFKGSPDEELWPISLNNDINRLDRVPLGNIVIPWQGEVPEQAPVNVNFADLVKLSAYNLAFEPLNSLIQLNLYWQSASTLTHDYTIFVHVLDQNGDLIASHDGQPAGGRFPTSVWREGMTIEDRHAIQLPDSLPGGPFEILVGIYLPDTGERLEIIDSGKFQSMNNALLLDQISYSPN